MSAFTIAKEPLNPNGTRSTFVVRDVDGLPVAYGTRRECAAWVRWHEQPMPATLRTVADAR